MTLMQESEKKEKEDKRKGMRRQTHIMSFEKIGGKNADKIFTLIRKQLRTPSEAASHFSQ